MKLRGKLLLLFIVSLFLIGCSSTNDADEAGLPEYEETDAVPVVTMTMENGGVVEIELYPNVARNTVNNFISLVQQGFYDGLTFHRVIPDFMIQGGDPQGTGIGGPGYSIFGEFQNNGYENDLAHERGVISMARSQHPDSAGSQFFIMVAKAEHLDGDYAAFGKVKSGMEVVDEIVHVERDNADKPLEDQVIKSMTVELNGYEFEEPVKIE
jgi:peptidyl-prolyl cis-trans isomerase B (cyclophilin B)